MPKQTKGLDHHIWKFDPIEILNDFIHQKERNLTFSTNWLLMNGALCIYEDPTISFIPHNPHIT